MVISADSSLHLFSLHGLAIKLTCRSAFLAPALEHALETFRIRAIPSTNSAVQGAIELYRESEVLRRLPATAARLSPPGELTELWQHEDMHWLIDDRWGLAEINLLRNQWRSWIIPQPTIHPERCLDLAALWPLAQLLRGKGLALVQAASVVRDDWGVLLIGHPSLEAELGELLRAGFRIVGQRWTALREESGHIAMLHMPGRVERAPLSRPRQIQQAPIWVDLAEEFCGSTVNKTWCDAVLLIERGRRPVARAEALPRASALHALRQNWPTAQLRPLQRLSPLHLRMARECKVFAATLSRRPGDILELIDTARYTPAWARAVA